MNFMCKSLFAVTLGLSTMTAFSSPDYLITHNNTTEESNAYIANVPSLYPTAAKTTQKVFWNLVRMACYGHTTPDKKCQAVIKMATNTPNPIELGTLTLNLDTGDISPKYLSNNGYTLIVNNPGEATISKN